MQTALYLLIMKHLNNGLKYTNISKTVQVLYFFTVVDLLNYMYFWVEIQQISVPNLKYMLKLNLFFSELLR